MLRSIIEWAVVAVVVSILIGIGVGVMSMTPPDFVIAKAAFALAGIILAAKVVHWGAKSTAAKAERMILTFIICGAIGVLAVESWRWVNTRHALATQAKSVPSQEVEEKLKQNGAVEPP